MVSGVCLQKTDFNYVSESNDVISSEQQHKLDDPKDEVSMWCQLFSYKGSYLDFYVLSSCMCVGNIRNSILCIDILFPNPHVFDSPLYH